MLYQDWPPLSDTLKHAVTTFKAKQPQVTLTLVPVGYGDLPTKVKTAIAAGAGPEMFHTYSDFWRAVDASQVMLALTPLLFSRDELNQLTFPTLLDSVPAKRKEVYLLPYADGLNGDALLYNKTLLASGAVDPNNLTTLDDIISAGAKLTQAQGGTISRAGNQIDNKQDPIRNWILDQGDTFYDTQNHKWTWQTNAAEQAMQKIVDFYKQGTAWVKAPQGIKDPIGEAQAAMKPAAGFYELSGYAKSYPHTELVDVPMPGFVPGKDPHYFQTAISGFALSALLKPGDERAKIGAAFLRHLFSPSEVTALADQYSGAIFINGIYSDAGFKGTTFGPVRSFLSDKVIAHTLMMDMAVEPGFGTQINNVIAGTQSIQAALAEMQQIYTGKEDEARKNMTQG